MSSEPTDEQEMAMLDDPPHPLFQRNIEREQRTFDASVGGILKQGKAAWERHNGCRYRTTDGCGCAVGVLIPPDKYKSHWEGTRFAALTPLRLLMTGLEYDVGLLNALQRAHDRSVRGNDDAIHESKAFIAEFKRKAGLIAKNRGLKTDVLA